MRQKKLSTLNSLVAGVADIAFVRDLDGRLRIGNAAFRERVALFTDDWENQQLRDILPVRTAETIERYDKQLVDEGGPLHFEEHLDTPQQRFHFRVHMSLWYDETDEPCAIVTIAQDISRQKEAELQRRRRDAVLEAIALASERFLGDHNWTASIEPALASLGRAAEASRIYIFEHFFGKNGESRIRQLYEWADDGISPQIDNQDLVDVPCDEPSFVRWKSLLSEGQVLYGNVRDFPKAEREVLEPQEIISLLTVPIFADGTWWGFIGFDECRYLREWEECEIDALRVAARILGAAIASVRQRRALGESESRYRAILQAVPDLLCLLDKDGRYLDFHPGEDSMTFVPPASFLGRTMREVLPPEIVDQCVAAHARTLETGKPQIIRYEAEFENRHRLYEVRLVPCERDRVLAVVRDITESASAAEKTLETERMATIGRLAAGVAHQFNNLNAPILGYADMIRNRDDVPLDVRLWAERMHNASLRVQKITDDLIVFARLRRPSIESPQSINMLVEEAIENLRQDLHAAGIVIETDLAETPEVMVDGDQLRRVLDGVLSNAQHALLGQPVRRIRVETFFADERVRIRIADTGCGIPAGNLPHVFTPFYTTKGEFSTSHSPQRKVRGIGMGLSVAQSIVRQHGGDIQVESEDGIGSSFTILLPPASPEKRKPTDRLPLPTESLRGRVLVLDDEEPLRTMSRAILKQDGHDVAAFADGRQALQAIRQENFDLVLVDLLMPLMSGTEFLERLLEVPPDRRPLALVVTGHVAKVDLDELAGLPVFGTLLKPFAPEDLLERVQVALATKRGT